jgi:FtsH-binding integral membrane protein
MPEQMSTDLRTGFKKVDTRKSKNNYSRNDETVPCNGIIYAEGRFMKWYRLTTVQFIVLLFLIASADVFTIVQKNFFPEIFRPFSYLLFVVLVLLVFFFIIKPDEPMVLAQTLTVILGIIALILVIIQDVVIAYSLSWRTGIVLLGAVAGPIAAGYCYAKIHTRTPLK